MNKVAFLMIAALLLGLCAVACAQEFPDVPPDHWAYDAVQELVDQGIIQGYPDGTFGGKRAMTRYEFAEALAKAIPVIADMANTGGPGGEGRQGPPGPAGVAGPPGPKGEAGVGAEQLATIQRMMDEFQDELASLGVQVESVRRDLNALSERVGIVEEEQARVRLTGDVSVIATGDVTNAGTVVDRDGRLLSVGTEPKNPLANSSVLTDFQLGIAGKVSDAASMDALIAAGDYLASALNTTAIDDFTLYRLNLKTAVGLGPFGQGEAVIGRFPLQLTPLTLKFVDPDSYTYVGILDSGDFVADGGQVTLNISKIALTAFAAKVNPIASLITPTLLTDTNRPVSQVGGVRAIIDAGSIGDLGVTYYQAGVAGGHVNISGADLNTEIGSIGLAAEYAMTDPNDAIKGTLLTGVADAGEDNAAWNAKLNFMLGNLGVGAGYSVVEQNYVAPGSWARLGALVNPVNVKGVNADLTYALTSNIQLTAEGQYLQPNDDTVDIDGRTGIAQNRNVNLSGVDKIDYVKVGLQYGLSSANTIDLGWEQLTVNPVAAGADTEERFISIGVGHTFNPNASMKLLYQIVEYEAGLLNPSGIGNFRGGVAAAQFGVKF